MESFFHTLKVEFVRQGCLASRENSKRELFASLEGCRSPAASSALGYRTPEQAEQLADCNGVH